MDNNLFDDLVASIKEAGAIKRNEIKASRVTELELPDIKEVREKTGLTQAEFAARLHISARTLQNWEQGRRYPTSPAATLIRILDALQLYIIKNPGILLGFFYMALGMCFYYPLILVQ